MVLRNRTVSVVLALLVAMLMVALVLLAEPARSQVKQTQSNSSKLSEMKQTSLVGAPVEVREDRNRKARLDRGDVLKIPGKNPKVARNASITLEDGDGTRATVTNNREVTFSKGRRALIMEVTDELPAEGDDELNTNDIQVIQEDGVTIIIIGDPEANEEDNLGETTILDESPVQEETTLQEEPTQVEETTSPQETTMDPEPQDEEKGPLAGGAAFGDDVLVPGDPVDNDGDGEQDVFNGEPIVGLDQITIETENCELTGEGDDLTVTLNDVGDVPFRLRDGQNVDIRLEGDTIIADGRDNVDGVDNPTRIIVQIPVDPENADFSNVPADAFPIVSSTGVGGEGCRAVNDADDATDLDTTPDTNTTDDVNTGDDLPNTGGGPADTRTALLFVLSGFALVALRIAKSRRRA